MPLTTSVVNDIVSAAEGLHQCGTFGPNALAALAKHLSKRHIRCSAETGSGVSTLLFSHCSDQHIAFSIDSGGGSVVNVQASPLLRADHVTWIQGPTQLTLPTYRFQHKLQAALIDGPHAYPFPDLEYYYLYQHLEAGALLVIDDIQIPTIHNLFDFLKKDRMFVLEEVVDTTAFFTRSDAPMFYPIADIWWEQEYNKAPQPNTAAKDMEEIANLRKEREELLRTIQLPAKAEEIDTLKQTLNAIYSSHGWKALSLYYRMRDSFQPRNMVRRCVTLLSPRYVIEGVCLLRDMRLVTASGLFDGDWYLQQNPDVAKAGVNPLRHYLRRGAAEGRDPNPLFDSDWYLQQNPDVAKAGVNPLRHYLRRGAVEGRDPSPHFDSDWYLQTNPDVAKAGVNPLVHYIKWGASEGRAATGLGVGSVGRGILPARVREIAAAQEQPVDPPAPASREEMEDTSWQDYEALANQISALRQSRVERLSPQCPSLVEIPDGELSRHAESLTFPTNSEIKVSIVIRVFNNLKFTLECLASIMNHSSGASYEIIMVDDGSSDQTPEILPRIANITYLRNEVNLGFVHSCNRGAEQARGKYVLFLNNDVQVTKGWLKPLMDTFREHAKVGAVGPKILDPNGCLQEAGALINRDGTSKMIGLFDDPDLPRYNYVREVTYCSGACLLVKANIFKELGGFDTSFAPAYCEDCDLSFRLRHRGLRVIYNPKSVVIHHLSITANSIEDSFEIQSVVRNRQKLAEKWQRQIDSLNKVRAIAFYLPQYHPIPENDRWWGKGFTEWSNVAKARPNFLGHYQPHLPADLGFYDIRVEEVMEQQADLAMRYGIYGFCYYYYWFAGKRLLELPLERMLRTNKPNFPFCIAWANENWTRRWDGHDNEVLIGQQHSEDDDRAVIRDMLRYMRHDNYIRINGRPLLIIYRATLLPDSRRTTEIWRDFCRKEGLGEIYLAMAESFEYAGGLKNPSEVGFDASVEFPPHGMHAPIDPAGTILNPNYSGVVHDYRQVVLNYLQLQHQLPGHVRFRSVMSSWDNTARRQNDPTMFGNSSPGAYQAWLEAVIEHTHEQNFGDERIVFINAWNEWAEGTHLEPDMRNGHAFLEATRNAQDAWLRARTNVGLG